MIKTNGMGFLALNCARMLEADDVDINLKRVDINLLESKIRNDLKDLPFKFEVFEVDLSNIESAMDGNIRMIIKK
jgi:hypothetical protein